MLPPGYGTSTRRYPVLYMHDGEKVFGPHSDWHPDDTYQWLVETRQIPPIIVVGIASGGRLRLYEDGPWQDRYWGGGGGGAGFLIAIRDSLKPEIDGRYRTMPDAAHTFMAGASLAGLLSVYAGYEFGSTFGRVAAFSPPYAWADTAVLEFARGRGRGHLVRLYQDTGTIGDNSRDILYQMRQVAADQGFREGSDLMTVVALGQSHGPRCWRTRVPAMLKFLVGE